MKTKKNKQLLRVGIAGMGGIAKRMHIPVLKLLPEYEIVCGAEKDDNQRKRVAELYNIKETYNDFAEMIEKADIDALFICLPATLHVKAVLEALKKGIHVFCEKPVGLNAEDAMVMVKTAKNADRVLMPGYNIRHVDNFRRAKKMIQSRRLGKIIQVNAIFINPGPYISWDPKSDWYLDYRSGGALYDIGSHIVDLLFYIFPHKIAELQAFAMYGYEPYDAVTNVVCSYRTNNDVLGTIQIGWRSASEACSLEFHGTAGTLIVSRRNFSYTHGATDPADRIAINSNNILQEFKVALRKLNLIRKGVDVLDEFKKQALDYKALVEGKRSNEKDLDNTILVHEVLEGINRSLKTGSKVKLHDNSYQN